MNYESLINYIESFINYSWKISEKGSTSIKDIISQYKKLQHCSDNEKLTLAKDIFSKIKITELKYDEEYEIEKKFPQYNGLIETIDYLNEIEDINIRIKKIEQIENAKYEIIRTIEKLDKTNINSNADITNDILCSINTMFENQKYRNILTNKELYTLYINYFKLKQNPRTINKVTKKIMPINDKIWANDLTNPNNFKQGEKFKFLVHNFMSGNSFEEQIYAMENYRNNRISCSLITDSFVGIYDGGGERRAGFIYPYNSNIIASGKKDLYTIEDGENYIIRNKEYASNILSPDFLEKVGKIQTTESNEEFDYSSNYNEVLIQYEKPSAVYLIGYGEKDLNSDYQELKEIAKTLNIPFIEIDMSEYRTKIGLEPLGEKGKKYITNQVLNSYFDLTMNCNTIDEETLNKITKIAEICSHDISISYLKLKTEGKVNKKNMNLMLESIVQQKGLIEQFEAVSIGKIGEQR